MDSEKYITILESFLKYDLSNIELIIYSIIYGFTQNGQTFRGSYKYLKKWCKCKSDTTIWNNITSLQNKGLIKKISEHKEGNINYCEYIALSNIESGEYEPLSNIESGEYEPLSKNETTTFKNCKSPLSKNEIDNTKIHNISKNKVSKEVSKEDTRTYSQVIDSFNLSEELKNVFTEWVKFRVALSKTKKIPLTNFALEKAIKKVLTFPIEKQVSSVEEGILRGWQGVFETKEVNSKPKTGSSIDLINEILKEGVENGTNTRNLIENK